MAHGINSCMSIISVCKIPPTNNWKGSLTMVFKEGYAKTHSPNLPSKSLNPQNLINTSSCLREFKGKNMITMFFMEDSDHPEFSKTKIQHIPPLTWLQDHPKDACSNLATHNRDQRRRANHCPRCNWFDRNWNKWPEWDGNSDGRGLAGRKSGPFIGT